MAKPLQQDSEGNIIGDVETAKNQKGASAYEAELAKKQAEMNSKDAKTKAKWNSLLEAGMGMLSSPTKAPVEIAKGGMVKSSASKRADGCAIRGKTRA